MHAAIIVHGLADAQVALRAAAETGVPVTLLSAPGAAGYGGAAWFDAVQSLAAEAVPQAIAVAVLDCGDAPGLVMGALRQGLKAIRFTGPAPVAAKLAELAAAHGATLITDRVPALDLRDTRDPLAACRTWLANHAE